MNILIIGKDSLLGKSLAYRLRKDGHNITGTTRNDVITNRDIFFDLSTEEENWPNWPDDIDAAFIATAITKQSLCQEQPDIARFINIDQTLKLISSLRAKNIHVVYPSTNLVLSCKNPYQPDDAPLRPIGFYGKTKAEIETSSINKEGVTIARLPKILDGDSGLLNNWQEKLTKGIEVSAYNNLIISPISLSHAVDFLYKLIQKQPGGIWQISGEEELSYYQLCCKLAEFISAPTNLVKSGVMPESIAATPIHPSLSCKKTQKALGIGNQSLSNLLKDCCQL